MGNLSGCVMTCANTIQARVGTPQETQDWTCPDEWIDELLLGDKQALAFHLWEESNGVINPRHLTGVCLLCSQYHLLEADGYDILHVTAEGNDFVNNSFGKTVQQIDYSEGLLNLLLIVAEHGPGKRSDYLPLYSEFLDQYSSYRTTRVQTSAWYYRIRNLHERGLVARTGVTSRLRSRVSYISNK